MSSTFNPHESALLAVLSEVSKAGYDLDELLTRAKSGVLGNALYVNVGPELKPLVLEALQSSATEAKRLQSL